MSDTPKDAVSCCGYDVGNGTVHPVYWNEFNKVVQCHSCGEIWEPRVIPAKKAEAENAALRLDADRYRWLRNQVTHATFTPIAQVVWKRNNNPHDAWVNLGDGKDLDAAIDAAMKEEGK